MEKALVAIRWEDSYEDSTTVYQLMLMGWIVHQLALGVLSNIRTIQEIWREAAWVHWPLQFCAKRVHYGTTLLLHVVFFQLSFGQFSMGFNSV